MANMTISVNDNIKRDFTRFCDDVGLTASAVLNVCMVTIARERRIPFTIAAAEQEDDVRAKAIDTFKRWRKEAESSMEPELTLDEINAEINAVREAKG